MDADEFDDVMRSFLEITRRMDRVIDEQRLINGRLETRIEEHDQVFARHEQTLGRLDSTLNKMEGTLARLDKTMAAQTDTLQTIKDRL